jgi:hypothetical protein
MAFLHYLLLVKDAMLFAHSSSVLKGLTKVNSTIYIKKQQEAKGVFSHFRRAT